MIMSVIDLEDIPTDPGCYRFKDKTKKILYIGKAKNLRKRVKSYFQKRSIDPKTQAMLDKAESVDYIVTDNEVEALILENNLIKRYQPKYNIDFKDSKRYSYIELTTDNFPRLLIGRRRTGQSKFFGPFVNAGARDYILYVLRRNFRIRTCKRLPKRACLRYHINLCSAPCIGKISKDDYQNNIEKIQLILKGRTKKLVKELTAEMKSSSKNLEYEHALELRNQIEAINYLTERQAMERQKRFNEDILNFEIKNGRVCLILFNVYKGTLVNKQEFEFGSQPDFLEEFILQFYSENPIPKELIIPENISDPLKVFLESKRESKVKVTVPKRGEKKKLLELVYRNVEVTFFGNIDKLEDLKKKLNLQDIPEVIECFDISHLSGTSMVGSMVQFRSALPSKDNYRRYKIRTVDSVDDTSAISEVVRRRYKRLILERKRFPDLIIIDGGLGQLNAALKSLWELEVKIPIIAIAKKFEEIYTPGAKGPIRLDKRTKALKLIQQIRDEAHRFALQYNRMLRSKELKKNSRN
jgi:excinuclease ABC subunit C